MSKELLLIFTRNPERGKVKTRLAASVGDDAALEIYNFLLRHTRDITLDLDVDKQVHYSETIRENDLWDDKVFDKVLQSGGDLGVRMKNAFEKGFRVGYDKIVIIGSDIYDLSTEDIRRAFHELKSSNIVIGEAQDGGYYLLGMTKLHPKIFQNKNWGTNTVFADTVSELEGLSVFYLPVRNDIDVFEDLLGHDVFNQYTKKLNE